MSHPEPKRRTNAPPGRERRLAGVTPEQPQSIFRAEFLTGRRDVVRSSQEEEALRWYAHEVLVCEGDLIGEGQASHGHSTSGATATSFIQS
jgi:hypothetical protein